MRRERERRWRGRSLRKRAVSLLMGGRQGAQLSMLGSGAERTGC